MNNGVAWSSGLFSGNPRTEWLSDRGDDRRMRLLEPFWYLDPQGRRWDVPAGTVINGASIPRTLWSSVGTPYTGDYRRASVVHDAAIHTAGIVRDEADTMFYYACLTGGCTLLQAKLLYGGVRIGSWVDVGGRETIFCLRRRFHDARCVSPARPALAQGTGGASALHADRQPAAGHAE